MFLRKNEKSQITVRFGQSTTDKYSLVEHRVLDELAGNPNPKKHSNLALVYFTFALTIFCTFIALSEFALWRIIPIGISFISFIASGIFHSVKFKRAQKHKQLLEKIKEKTTIEFK